MITAEQIDAWIQDHEDEHLEFKEAKTNIDSGDLVNYCVALANECGGRLILGVTNKRPRRVIGSQACLNLAKTRDNLLQRLHLRIEAEEILHPGGRVVVFTVPSRPAGVPLHVDGRYLMRSGESLTGMTQEMLKRIFAEAGPDFSAEVCPGATFDDLDPAAIERFRSLWRARSGNPALEGSAPDQLLHDAELLVGGQITYAALILLGTHKALGRHLAQAEVVFEYRSNEVPGPAQQRIEYRRGFVTYFDELWSVINLRNDQQHFQDGLFMRDVPTFNEGAVREAVLNAVAHRDYRLGGSVFVRQFPRRIEISSPGGFPQGITAENILYRQNPRNRRLAEALARCGFVERAGQGADRMFAACIREGKALPDFARTDAYEVDLTLHGDVQDPRFIRFLEQVSAEKGVLFGVADDLLVLHLVHREQPVPDLLRPAVRKLIELGIVERAGRKKLVLSRRFHAFLGQSGRYTRKVGLDRETNKMLLLKHIRDNAAEGSRMEELRQVLPSLSAPQVKHLVLDLRDAGQVRCVGTRRWARWYPASIERPKDPAPGEGQ